MQQGTETKNIYGGQNAKPHTGDELWLQYYHVLLASLVISSLALLYYPTYLHSLDSILPQYYHPYH